MAADMIDSTRRLARRADAGIDIKFQVAGFFRRGKFGFTCTRDWLTFDLSPLCISDESCFEETKPYQAAPSKKLKTE